MGKGPPGSMSTFRAGHKCRRVWTPYKGAGVFDSTPRRVCLRCGRIQTKSPSPSR